MPDGKKNRGKKERFEGVLGRAISLPGGTNIGSTSRSCGEAFTAALTEGNILNLVAKVLELAQSGDTTTIRLLLDRALGRVQPPESFAEGEDELETEEEIQAAVRRVRKIQPDYPSDILVKKTELLLRLESLSETLESKSFLGRSSYLLLLIDPLKIDRRQSSFLYVHAFTTQRFDSHSFGIGSKKLGQNEPIPSFAPNTISPSL